MHSWYGGGDDSYIKILLSSDFKYYGKAYKYIYIGTNGYVTFGYNMGDLDSYESLQKHFDTTRLSYCFTDLTLNQGGELYFGYESDTFIDNSIFVISYKASVYSNSHQTIEVKIKLYLENSYPINRGRVTISYGDVKIMKALVGLSPGYFPFPYTRFNFNQQEIDFMSQLQLVDSRFITEPEPIELEPEPEPIEFEPEFEPIELEPVEPEPINNSVRVQCLNQNTDNIVTMINPYKFNNIDYTSYDYIGLNVGRYK